MDSILPWTVHQETLSSSPPTEAELSLLPPHEVYCVPLIHSSIPHCGSLYENSHHLLLLGETLFGMGVFVILLCLLTFPRHESHTVVCMESYMLLHVLDFVLQVVKVVQCLVNTQNGCHVFLYRSFLAQHDVQCIGYNIPSLIHDDGWGGCSCLHVEQFYTMQSILLHFLAMQGAYILGPSIFSSFF